MITLQQFMDAVEYRISEGSNYSWNSFGPTAYRLESIADAKYNISIVFDTTNQTVYEVEAHDYSTDYAYRYTNPLWIDAVRDEAQKRGINYDIAYDNVKFIDLEVEDDWLEKARAIVRGEDYDTRVKIPLELDKEELLTLMTAAHEQDITLNDYVERILRQYVLDYEVGGSRV